MRWAASPTTRLYSRGRALTLKVGGVIPKFHQLLGLGYISCIQTLLFSDKVGVMTPQSSLWRGPCTAHSKRQYNLNHKKL